MKDLLELLAKTANQVDQAGAEVLADRLDAIIRVLAETEETVDEMPPRSEEEFEFEYEDEEVEYIYDTVERLRELRDVLPADPIPVPPGSMAEEMGYDPEGEYQEQVEEVLQEEMEAEEEGELQHQLMGESIGWVDDAMLEHGIIPMRGSKSGYLGTGAFSTVRRGLYDEQEVAVKITRVGQFENTVNDEAQVWTEILDIKDYLSQDTQKHLPEIHEIIHHTDDRQMIVMELLEQPEPHVMRQIWKYDLKRRQRRDASFAEYFKGTDWMETVYNFIDSRMYSELDKLDQSEKDILFKAIFSMPVASTLKALEDDFNKYSKFQEAFIKHLKAETPWEPTAFEPATEKIIQQNINQPWTSEYDDDVMPEHLPSTSEKTIKFDILLTELAETFLAFLVELEMSAFPSSYQADEFSDKALAAETAPEARSFLAALRELAEHGILWRDLHRGNVMQRPGTKELVIIDVGLYSAPIKSDYYESNEEDYPAPNYYGPLSEDQGDIW